MNKHLKGGAADPFLQLKSFISLVIFGYFGVKIVYGLFFKFYPEKFYYRNIDINTNEVQSESSEDNTKNVTLNAYMPGVWNTEITDFVVTIILSLIVYIYTNLGVRSMIEDNGNINTGLLLGYILGLGFPPFLKTIQPLIKPDPNNNMGRWVLNCLSYGLFIVIIAVIVIVNYVAADDMKNIISYTTFIATIILLLFGLFLARKTQQTVGPVTYYYSEGESCKSKSQKYVMSSGDLVKISPVFCSFILLLLFSYDPADAGWKYIYIMMFGIFLGVFVSGLSYYGIEYFMLKQPIKQCNSLSECSTVEDPTVYDEEMTDQLQTVNDNNKSLNIIKVIMLIALIVVVAFLINKNVNK